MTDPADTSTSSAGSPETLSEMPVAGSPSDNTTLIGVLNTWNERGFGGQFVGVDGGRIECVDCGAVSHASDFVVEEWRRLEGASDPDDMVKAVAAHCPACGAGGNLVLGYGVNASDLDAEISTALTATDDTSVQTPDSSIGE
jgi:hypothetical protein